MQDKDAPQAQTWTDDRINGAISERVPYTEWGSIVLEAEEVRGLMLEMRDDLQATIDRQAQEIAALKQAARALYAALWERENCEVCGGVGTMCDCSVSAQAMLAEYSEWKGEGTDGN